MHAYKSGLWSEYFARIYLLFKGYTFLQKRFKTKVGEIDLLMGRGKTLIAVEVKKRRSLDEGFYALQKKQCRRIHQTLLLAQKRYPHYINIRCDIILISWYKWPIHITNAF